MRCVFTLFAGFICFVFCGPVRLYAVDEQSARSIEDVLMRDVGLVSVANSTAGIAVMMKDADLSACPIAFREAYMDYTHKWESVALLERAAKEFRDDIVSPNALLEFFFRGFAGDVAGPAVEILAGVNRFKAEAVQLRQQMQSSYQSIETIAVKEGADLRAINAHRKFLAEHAAAVAGAAAGDVSAMVFLGRAYEASSDPLVKDSASALRWYRKGADAGNPMAMLSVAKCYQLGIGVDKDEAEALRWHLQAASHGSGAAMFLLAERYQEGSGVRKDGGEAIRWFRKAAEAKNDRAMVKMGQLYASGAGVPKDAAEAARWWHLAAEAGNAEGMALLGSAYATGSGIQADEAESIRWHLKGANAGSPTAMLFIGLRTENGFGVEKNEAEAIRWYSKILAIADASIECRKLAEERLKHLTGAVKESP